MHHLVEAATALTQLVTSVPQAKVSKTHQISDDEDASKSKPGQQRGNTLIAPSPPNMQHTVPNQSMHIEAKPTPVPSAGACTREIFPQRLMRILSDPTISDIVTWLPHGRSFVIIQPETLAEKILPIYFPESCTSPSGAKSSSTACKYPSFTRKLNRWGFRQVTRGPDAGAFHHKFFNRDEPGKCLQMICQRSRRHKSEDKRDVVNILPNKPPSQPRPQTIFNRVSNPELTSDQWATIPSFPKVAQTMNSTFPPIPKKENQALLSSRMDTSSPVTGVPTVSNTTSPSLKRPNLAFSNGIKAPTGDDQLDDPLPLLQRNLVLNAAAAALKQGQVPFGLSRQLVPRLLQQQTGQIVTGPTPPSSHRQATQPPPQLQAMLQQHPTSFAQDNANSAPASLAKNPAVAALTTLTAAPALKGSKNATSEEVRIANAKSMLYSAFLSALG